MSLKLTNVEAILAVDLFNGLAKNEIIPWKSKTDLTFFKNKTLNNTVVMGSKTLLSLPNAMPLKNRTNIVITNQKEKYSNMYKTIDNVFFLDLKESIYFMKTTTNNKFFIIGGNQIYNELMPYCSSIWLTKIKQNYNCDLIFNYDISRYTKEVIYQDNELEIMCLK
jgi:dihydrofolate reductase